MNSPFSLSWRSCKYGLVRPRTWPGYLHLQGLVLDFFLRTILNTAQSRTDRHGSYFQQRRRHRAEHWVVVAGLAKVTNGNNTFLLHENESTFIPKGAVHSLENPGNLPLEVIEVQSGDYFGEDDIERFEDRYGRVK